MEVSPVGCGTEPGNWAERVPGPHQLGCRPLPGAACQLPMSLSQTARRWGGGVAAASSSRGCRVELPRCPVLWGMGPTIIFPAEARSHFWRNLVSDSRGEGVLRGSGNSYSWTISEL